jgi:hypothetical protein
MPATITTNHQWRDFVYRSDVPADVLASEFDWTNDEDFDGFFRYRGEWYHLSMFEWRNSIPGFDGIHCDSFYSGVVIKVSADGEQYKVGTLIA